MARILDTIYVKDRKDLDKIKSGTYDVIGYALYDDKTSEKIDDPALIKDYYDALGIDHFKVNRSKYNSLSGKGNTKKIVITAISVTACIAVLGTGIYHLNKNGIFNKPVNKPTNVTQEEQFTPQNVHISSDVEGAHLGDGTIDYATYDTGIPDNSVMAAQLDEAKEVNSGLDYNGYTQSIDEDLLTNLRTFLFNGTSQINGFLCGDNSALKGEAVYVDLTDAFQETYDRVVVNYFSGLRNNVVRTAFEQRNRPATRNAWIDTYNKLNDFVFNQGELVIDGNTYIFIDLSTPAQVALADLLNATVMANPTYGEFMIDGQIVDCATYSGRVDELESDLQYMVDYLRSR